MDVADYQPEYPFAIRVSRIQINRMTRELILSPAVWEIWATMDPSINSDSIVKLALGPKKANDLKFSDWESLLAEIIVGNAFGVDRMGYLLRDSLHTGVAYGRFDHFILTLFEVTTQQVCQGPDVGGQVVRCLGHLCFPFLRYIGLTVLYPRSDRSRTFKKVNEDHVITKG